MNITVTLLAQVIAFILLIWFVNKVLWKPMMALLDARQKRIADGLAAADRGKKEQELAEKRALETLADAKRQATDIISQAQKRANAIVEEAKTTARTEAGRIVTAANAEVEQEMNRARETLRKEVASVALTAAGKILKREVDAKAHATILNELAANI